jgi:hypothetical protein
MASLCCGTGTTTDGHLEAGTVAEPATDSCRTVLVQRRLRKRDFAAGASGKGPIKFILGPRMVGPERLLSAANQHGARITLPPVNHDRPDV